MNLDFVRNDFRFNARTSAVIYNKDLSKVLLFNVEGRNFYMLPGGRIEELEESIDTIKREIKEEIGCDVQEASLFSIQENFWTRNDKKCHGIEFYYIIKPKQKLQMQDYEKIENDKGEEKLLEFKWATAEELKDIDLRPVNIRDMLINEEYLKGLSHVVKRG